MARSGEYICVLRASRSKTPIAVVFFPFIFGMLCCGVGLLCIGFVSIRQQTPPFRWEVVDPDHGIGKSKYGVDIHNSGETKLLGPCPFWYCLEHGTTNELILVNSFVNEAFISLWRAAYDGWYPFPLEQCILREELG